MSGPLTGSGRGYDHIVTADSHGQLLLDGQTHKIKLRANGDLRVGCTLVERAALLAIAKHVQSPLAEQE